jgi:hypothetical protein
VVQRIRDQTGQDDGMIHRQRAVVHAAILVRRTLAVGHGARGWLVCGPRDRGERITRRDLNIAEHRWRCIIERTRSDCYVSKTGIHVMGQEHEGTV